MRTLMVGALSAATLMLAGCGSAGSYENTPRPPAPINVSVNLTNDRVRVSPERVGAGPVVLLVNNSSATTRDVTLTPASDASGPCVRTNASSGPINPQGNARVQLQLVQGDCTIGVRDASLHPARLIVGAERGSAQADLLQP